MSLSKFDEIERTIVAGIILIILILIKKLHLSNGYAFILGLIGGSMGAGALTVLKRIYLDRKKRNGLKS